MNKNIHYCCTNIDCDHEPLLECDDGLRCQKGHFFPYAHQTKIPVFACIIEDENEYALKNAANVHDNSLAWIFNTFGTDEASVRKRLIDRLHLSKGQVVLITGAGAGNDLPYLAQSLEGGGTIYAQDISKQMLVAGVDRYKSRCDFPGIDIYFSVSNALNLPFSNNVFDAAYHFGGLNLFQDIQQGIAEMNRVVKPGGQVVIGDEGVAPWLRKSELSKMLINNNSLYAYDAPLAFLPETAQSVKLSWELGNCFYVIEFTVSTTLPVVNVDIPHIGRRGGSVRSRYFGQLEGVDPALRDRVYAEAEKQGMSRVAYLEYLLKKACL